MVCEKCWSYAYIKAIADTAKTQTEHYRDLIEEYKDRLRGINYADHYHQLEGVEK